MMMMMMMMIVAITYEPLKRGCKKRENNNDKEKTCKHACVEQKDKAFQNILIYY